MEITPTTITLVGVVCVALGILAGLLINSLLDSGDETAGGTEEAPPGGRKGRYTPVFRVWREKQAGTLVVEMDGKAMINPDPLNEIQRERLEHSVRDLRAWLGMGLPAAQVSQPEETTQTATVEDDLSRLIAPANPTAYSSAPSVPPPARVSRTPVDPRAASVPPIVGKGKEEPIIPPVARSIVLQIEDILQDMITGTPLEQRGVHLLEDPMRGVIVQVGLEQFEGIDAVTDAHVRGVIQSAVQEWEKSQ